MKNLASLFLALLLCISLVACRSEKESDESSSIVNTAVTEDDSKAEYTEEATTGDSSVESTDEKSTGKVDTPTEATVRPLLYKVTDEDGSIVWLFGSIHVGKESYYPLPDYVIAAYESSDSLAVEFDLKEFSEDLAAQTKAMSIFIDHKNKISLKINEETYNKAVNILNDNGIYSPLLDLYIPIMWSSLIDNLLYEKMGVRSDLGIDTNMIDLAYEDEKTVIGIESAEFQYTLLAGFSDELQEKLLEDSIKAYEGFENGDPEVIEAFNSLVSAWEAGDEGAFELALREDYEFESKEEELLYAEYEKALVTDRNLSMTDFAEDALESNDEVFICVGAVHVVGEGAMADLLAERGYTVELITE